MRTHSQTTSCIHIRGGDLTNALCLFFFPPLDFISRVFIRKTCFCPITFFCLDEHLLHIFHIASRFLLCFFVPYHSACLFVSFSSSSTSHSIPRFLYLVISTFPLCVFCHPACIGSIFVKTSETLCVLVKNREGKSKTVISTDGRTPASVMMFCPLRLFYGLKQWLKHTHTCTCSHLRGGKKWAKHEGTSSSSHGAMEAEWRMGWGGMGVR